MINHDAPDFDNSPISDKRPDFGYRPEAPDAEPFVTILTPYYNPGPVFEETAQSVFQQSFQQWEWLIVDDGTTDEESLEILDRYRRRDKRIRVVRQENKGVSGARNTGFREARCEFVTQLDPDDLLEPTAIEKWVWFLVSYPEFSFVKGYGVGFGAEEYLWNRGFHQSKEFLIHNAVNPTAMIRRSVQMEVGGCDESNRRGLEDWDFWMKCANAGYWGSTVPEFLDWYRRRPSHGDRWSNWDGGERQETFRAALKTKYPKIWSAGMPRIECAPPKPFERVPDKLPCHNRLAKDRPRILLILPWMTLGGSDRFNLDLVQQLTAKGWGVTIATTLHGDNLWHHEFARLTPDIFVLENFLRKRDFPRYLHYLIDSRNIDVVMITHSLMGYMLLPYLRASCPNVGFVDYCHIEESDWLDGGYPRFGVGYQDFLDLNVTSSEYLRKWMVDRGARPEKIEVCYTAVDCDKWQPDPERRRSLRKRLGIAEDRTVLIYAGRLCAQKQPRVFAKTMSLLCRTTRDFVALVLGNGPDQGWLQRYVRRHGLRQQVRLLGAVPAEHMVEHMAAGDILFLPSKWEGIALSLYEAMATGLAVVAAAVGGQRELVPEDCGRLVSSGDPQTEAEQYARILAELIRDPARRRALSARARERVQRQFDIDRMGNRMVELLTRASEPQHRRQGPPVSRGSGLEAATMAVEYDRLHSLADHLWRTREERLGLQRTWRTSLLDLAYRSSRHLPAGAQRVLRRVYHHWFVRTR